MPLISIDTIDDPRLAVYRDLLSAKASRRSGLFIAEGSLLVERLVASSFDTHSILVDQRRVDRLPSEFHEHVVYVATAKLIEAIIGFNFHRGILACGVRQPPAAMEAVAKKMPSQATILVCVGINDPTNLGSILRSAAAFGIHAVILAQHCSDPFSRRVLRVSMGATFKLPLVESQDVLLDLQRLRDDCQVQRIATVLDHAETLEQADRSDRIAILIGNEAHGLPSDVVRQCERRVTIPMQLGTDSLNAAVAERHFAASLYPRRGQYSVIDGRHLLCHPLG